MDERIEAIRDAIDRGSDTEMIDAALGSLEASVLELKSGSKEEGAVRALLMAVRSGEVDPVEAAGRALGVLRFVRRDVERTPKLRLR
jgi:hypothetical protein